MRNKCKFEEAGLRMRYETIENRIINVLFQA